MIKWNAEFQAQLDELIILNEKGKLLGEFPNIPLEVYHHPLCPGVSKSSLKNATTYNRWVAYLKKRLEDYNDPEKDLTPKGDMLVGSAVHDLLFEPERFKQLYCKGLVIPNFGDKRIKANKEKYEDWTKLHLATWEKENVGRIALTLDDWNKIHAMAKRALETEIFQMLIPGGESEVTYFFRYTPGGPLLKSRPDRVHKGKRLVYDHKTTADAEVNAFKRTAKNFGYAEQLAMQIDGANIVLGGQPFMGLWGAQDRDEEPYDVAFYTPDDATLDQARNWINQKMTELENAKNGTAPKGYPKAPTVIGISGWVLT